MIQIAAIIVDLKSKVLSREKDHFMFRIDLKPNDCNTFTIGSYYGDQIIDTSKPIDQSKLSSSMFIDNFESSYVLPPGCVYLSNNKSIAIFKQPPMYREITYANKDAGAIENNELDDMNYDSYDRFSFRIPIPATLYVMIVEPSTKHLNQMHAFCYTSNKLTPDTELFLLPLPNYYIDGKLCMSSRDYFTPKSIYQYYNYLINSVWSSNYNYDTIGVLRSYIENLSAHFGNHKSFNRFFSKDIMPDFDYDDDKRDYLIFQMYSFLSSISMSEAINKIKWRKVRWADDDSPGLGYSHIERYVTSAERNMYDNHTLMNLIRSCWC